MEVYEKLKPCPFCGSADVNVGDFKAVCANCLAEASSKDGRTKNHHAQAWNSRTVGQRKDSCPFCGESKHIHLSMSKADEGRFWLYCKSCFASGPEGATEKEAIELWDKRAEVQE